MRAKRERLQLLQSTINEFMSNIQTGLVSSKYGVRWNPYETPPSFFAEFFRKQMIITSDNETLKANTLSARLLQDIQEIQGKISANKRRTADTINEFTLHSTDMKRQIHSVTNKIQQIKDCLDGKSLADIMRSNDIAKKNRHIVLNIKQLKSLMKRIKELHKYQIKNVKYIMQEQTESLKRNGSMITNEILRDFEVSKFRIRESAYNQLNSKKAELLGLKNHNTNLEKNLRCILIGTGIQKEPDLTFLDQNLDKKLSKLIKKQIQEKVAAETMFPGTPKEITDKYIEMYDGAIEKKRIFLQNKLKEAKQKERALIKKIQEATIQIDPKKSPFKTKLYQQFEETMSKIEDIRKSMKVAIFN